MKTVFADASFYVKLLSRRDRHAAAAQDFARSYSGRFVTTTAVLVEVGNFLADSKHRKDFPALVHELEVSRRVDIVGDTLELWEAGLRLYAERLDKKWSFTNCMSFLVMQDRGIHEALTADHHFEQAGFTILLK